MWDSIVNMDNTLTYSDSAVTNSPIIEGSHRVTTLTYDSAAENTFNDLTVVEPSSSHKAVSSPSEKEQCSQKKQTVNLPRESTRKADKQRQNEEIAILESSSLSSETGSWESVFPLKFAHKNVSENLKHNRNAIELGNSTEVSICTNVPTKSTSCFIDAASLVDDEDDIVKIRVYNSDQSGAESICLPEVSQPVPCLTVKKVDISPSEWSEINDNDDSLEEVDKLNHAQREQKNFSPVIFDMTPTTDETRSIDASENILPTFEVFNNQKLIQRAYPLERPRFVPLDSTTPNNSISAIKASSLIESETRDTKIPSNLEGTFSTHQSLQMGSPYPPGFLPPGSAASTDGRPLPVREVLKAGETWQPGPFELEEFQPRCTAGHCPLRTFSPFKHVPSFPSFLVRPAFPPFPVNNIPTATDNRPFDSATSGDSYNRSNNPTDKSCTDTLIGDTAKIAVNSSKKKASTDSCSTEKSSQKFYIDLSSLPDQLPEKSVESAKTAEKNNLFSMFIDISETSTNKEHTKKEMPSRFASSTTVKPKPDLNNSCNTQNTNESIFSFETLEILCNDPNISITEIIQNDPMSSSDTSGVRSYNGTKGKGLNSVKHNTQTKTASATIETNKEDPPGDLFVRLSDLDKPVNKTNTSSIKSENIRDARMTRSIPESKRANLDQAISPRSNDVISSFHSENALSLNRLFPHLHDLNRSMPGSLSSRTITDRSPLGMTSTSSGDEDTSDISDASTGRRSRSALERSTKEDNCQASSLISSCQSRLGQDLLRMFLEEIAPDVIVEVSGRRIKAHKCILSSRCQYFAGILSGGWVESAGNVISLPSFSYNVVHFALCHIYSGVCMIPDSISIVELATMSDMLGLEGLKEAIMLMLTDKYCHQFHRPCSVCVAGVLECFPLCALHGLDDLFRKCLNWITKYFSSVWPAKAFASLPSDLLDKCYNQVLTNLSVDSALEIVETVCGCGVTVAAIGSARYGARVSRMCRRMVIAAAQRAAPQLLGVVRSLEALPADLPAAARRALDDMFVAAIDRAPPDEGCRAYDHLSALVAHIAAQAYSTPDLLADGGSDANNLLTVQAVSLCRQVEVSLVRAAPRVVTTQAFRELPPELRKKLRELGCIMYGPQVIPGSPRHERITRSTNSRPTSSASIRSNTPSTRPVTVTKPSGCSKPSSNTITKTSKSSNSHSVGLDGARTAAVRRVSRVSSVPASPARVRSRAPPPPPRPPPPPPPAAPLSLGPTTRPADQPGCKYATYTKTKHNTGSLQQEKSKNQNDSSAAATTNRIQTKIPVYKNRNLYLHRHERKPTEYQKRTVQSAPACSGQTAAVPTAMIKSRPERKLPGSLMNATKSSSAKMQPKIVKDSSKCDGRNHTAKSTTSKDCTESSDIPAMERSGTFLKDEPTFGDKTTHFDIDQ